MRLLTATATAAVLAGCVSVATTPDESGVLWNYGVGLTAFDVTCERSNYRNEIAFCIHNDPAYPPSTQYVFRQRDLDLDLVPTFEAYLEGQLNYRRCSSGNLMEAGAKYGLGFANHDYVPHRGVIETEQFGRANYHQWLVEVTCEGVEPLFLLLRLYEGLHASGMPYAVDITAIEMDDLHRLADALTFFDIANERLFEDGILIESTTASL